MDYRPFSNRDMAAPSNYRIEADRYQRRCATLVTAAHAGRYAAR
jgi:hypothetical protein